VGGGARALLEEARASQRGVARGGRRAGGERRRLPPQDVGQVAPVPLRLVAPGQRLERLEVARDLLDDLLPRLVRAGRVVVAASGGALPTSIKGLRFASPPAQLLQH